MDADLATDVRAIGEFMEESKRKTQNNLCFLIGDRYSEVAQVERAFIRLFISRVFMTLVKLALRFNIRDT